MLLQQKFLHEIESGLVHHDISLLTRRMMDFCEEFRLSSEVENKVINLRKLFLTVENQQSAEILNSIAGEARELVSKNFTGTLEHKISDSIPVELLVSANNISKQFKSGKMPFKLHPIDIKLQFGEITGVVGENGNGKTTLLRMLAGELSSDTGSLFYPALNDEEGAWYDIKSKLAFIPQRIDKWYGTLLDNLRFFATIHGFTGEENEKRIDYILFRLGLDRFRDLKWSEISSGYRLRFELAKMLLWKPKLLILDEPLANLDINAQQLFLQDLKFFTQSVSHPVSIILSSQNLHEIERVADNIIFIRQGQTIYNGSQKDFALDRQQNSFEVSGKFDLDTLVKCFVNFPEIKVENAGTSFIITAGTNESIYTIMTILNEQQIELNYIRDISQSTRKLFHKDI